MIGRQLPAPLIAEHGALGDAKQGGVRFMIGRGGEIGLVAGNERERARIGEIDELRLDRAFLRQAVALQLHVKAIPKQRLQPVETRCRDVGAFRRKRQIKRAGRAARQCDQAGRARRQARQVDMGLDAWLRIEPGVRGKRHQVLVARLVLRQQHQRAASPPVVEAARRQRRAVTEVDAELHAGDRLHTLLRHLLREFERPEKIVRIGQRERRHAVRRRELDELRHRHRPFTERKRAVDMKMQKPDLRQDVSGLACGQRHDSMG